MVFIDCIIINVKYSIAHHNVKSSRRVGSCLFILGRIFAFRLLGVQLNAVVLSLRRLRSRSKVHVNHVIV